MQQHQVATQAQVRWAVMLSSMPRLFSSTGSVLPGTGSIAAAQSQQNSAGWLEAAEALKMAYQLQRCRLAAAQMQGHWLERN